MSLPVSFGVVSVHAPGRSGAWRPRAAFAILEEGGPTGRDPPESNPA
jgi:hypothetical protein